MQKIQTCEPKKVGQLLSTLVLFLGAFLNQSCLVFGINFSIADIILLVAVITLFMKKLFVLPFKPFFFFIMVSTSVLFASMVVAPALFSIDPSPTRIFSDYIKLLVVFFYFIVGYNLAKLGLDVKIFDGFSMIAIIVGAFSLVPFFLGKGFEFMYHENSYRFQGLMIDPNYFSVLQCCACAYIFSERNRHFKKIAMFLLTISILMSGSKTGVIVLCIYFIIRFIMRFFNLKINLNSVLFWFTVVVVIPILVREWNFFMNFLSDKIPPFNRIAVLFTTDLGTSSISKIGSGRNITWATGMSLINASPIFGIGVGTYTTITSSVLGVKKIAHNTYLQLAAEWGLPLALLFFIFVIWLLTQSNQKRTNLKMVDIYRDIVLIFLLGSLTLSLNNARLFWVTLGLLFWFKLNSDKNKLVSYGNN